MSSTDDKQLRAFFDAHLTPVADRLRARGRATLTLGPDDPTPTDADSWYSAPPSGPPLFTRERQDFVPALRAHWREQDLPELAALVIPLAALADELTPAAQDADDISPFVYVLF